MNKGTQLLIKGALSAVKPFIKQIKKEDIYSLMEIPPPQEGKIRKYIFIQHPEKEEQFMLTAFDDDTLLNKKIITVNENSAAGFIDAILAKI